MINMNEGIIRIRVQHLNPRLERAARSEIGAKR